MPAALCDYGTEQRGPLEKPTRFKCLRCGRTVRVRLLPIFRRCQEPGARIPRPVDWWTRRYIKKLGLRAAAGCQCQERAAEMRRLGPAGCREEIETLVDGFEEEVKRLGLFHKTVLLVRRDRFREVATRVVLFACRLAERSANRPDADA